LAVEQPVLANVCDSIFTPECLSFSYDVDKKVKLPKKGDWLPGRLTLTGWPTGSFDLTSALSLHTGRAFLMNWSLSRSFLKIDIGPDWLKRFGANE